MKNFQNYPKGIESAGIGYIILENLLILAMIVTGGLVMRWIRIGIVPIVSILYGIGIFFLLLFPLRKHLCTRCYYYGRNCHCGWGKLAAKLYTRGTGNQKVGGILAGITWIVLMGLPIVLLPVILLLYKVDIVTILPAVIPFFLLVGINSILHKKDCDECKMRQVCPGSAAKGK